MSYEAKEILYRVIGAIYRHVEGFAVLEYPRSSSRRSIDIVARFKNGRLALIKVTDDIESLSKNDVDDLKKVASIIGSGALIVSDRAGGSKLVSGVVYEKHGVKVINVRSLERSLSGRERIYVYQSGDTLKAKIRGSLMREIRVRRGLSLGAVASHVKVSRRTIYEYERGSIEPSVDKAERLAEIFGEEIFLPVDFLEPLKAESPPREPLDCDVEAENIIAEKLRSSGYKVAHVKRTAADLVSLGPRSGMIIVVKHGRESLDTMINKAVNSIKISRLSNAENYVVVDSSESKRALEKEGLESVEMREFLMIAEEKKRDLKL